MALRLHFDTEDLLATRFARSFAPLLELGLALATLRRQDALFAQWRSHLALPREARPVLALVPVSGAGPTFIDPVVSDLDIGLATVADSPSPLVHAELRRVFAERPVLPWVRDLDRRDSDAWQVLGDSLAAAHRTVIEPVAHRLVAGHRAEVASRAHTTARSGLRTMLAGLVPGSRWIGSVLSLPAVNDRDVALAGRGLTLVPSSFWTGQPLTCDHPDGSTALVYPSSTPLPVISRAPDGNGPLAALLGSTRAAILTTVRDGRATTALARELGISAASASEHTKVLREAGLVTSTRAGRAMVHTATPLGVQLVAGVE
jgi:DNA-binding transcriptional ArsR family regulator